MNQAAAESKSLTVDPDVVARVAREVIARLTASAGTPSADTAVAEGIITADSIRSLPGNPDRLLVGRRAVITPAARDEASERGISIETTATTETPLFDNARRIPTQNPVAIASTRLDITDTHQPERADIIVRQLATRGIVDMHSQIVLSDTPAAEVYRRCTQTGRRAVMIASIADVDRFATELEPDTWILDTLRINLVTAVNIIARIAQRCD
jgi:hypothetical protein